jgi:putative membrane protein
MVAMPSDRRFHPLTVLFALGGELRTFLVPLIFATVTAQSRGTGPQSWFLIFLIPGLVMAAGRYWFSTYRYDETELVVRTGIFFKNERHIPYTRIQSVDAVQNVMHRFLGVVDVKVQTGTGGEAEATLSVLPLAALDEMRARVFAEKQVAGEVAAPAVEEAASHTVLQLGPREIALSGVLDNRGWVVIGAMTGLIWESGVVDRIESWASLPESSAWTVAATGAAVAAGLFVVSPLLSLVWATVRLHGFTLSQRGTDLDIAYGALTRVTATIPLRRIQAVTITSGVGHLWTKRAAVRVETAGGTGAKSGESEREWVAPIIRVADLDRLVQQLLPGIPLDSVAWQPVDARAFGRRGRRAAVTGLILGAATSPWTGWWALAIVAALVALGVVAARQYVRGLGWARTEDAVYFREGWWRRSITIVPLIKIQCVQLIESPFDRRLQMASLTVDTAGAKHLGVAVPYLSRPVADDLRVALAAHAANTEYRW